MVACTQAQSLLSLRPPQDDNWEADEAPKPYGLPTSDELKQTLKDFKYDGILVRLQCSTLGLLGNVYKVLLHTAMELSQHGRSQ